MKKVKLPDGTVIQLPSSLSDLDVQRVVKELMGKLGELQAYEKGKEVVLINTQFPEFPSFPEFPEPKEPKDYNKALKKIADNLGDKNNADIIKAINEVNDAVNRLTASVNAQTKALVDATTEQSNVLAELVVAYREPKKITRDNQGRPEGIESER